MQTRSRGKALDIFRNVPAKLQSQPKRISKDSACGDVVAKKIRKLIAEDQEVNLQTSAPAEIPSLNRSDSADIAGNSPEVTTTKTHSFSAARNSESRSSDEVSDAGETSNDDDNFAGHLPQQRGIFPCGQCDKVFTFRKSLEDHEKRHSGRDLFKCFCGKSFTRRPHLIEHELNNHTPNEEKPYPCPVCSKAFVRKGRLECHMRRHTGERPFQCDVCNKSFIDKGNFTRHMKECTGEPHISCGNCERTFRDLSARANHMKRCVGGLAHSCQYCGEPFFTSAELVHHTEQCLAGISEGQLAFTTHKCVVCRQEFDSKEDLLEHRKETSHFAGGLVMTPGSQYAPGGGTRTRGIHPCPMCEARFDAVEVLKMHVSSVHRVRVVEAYAHPGEFMETVHVPMRELDDQGKEATYFMQEQDEDDDVGLDEGDSDEGIESYSFELTAETLM